MKRRAFLSGRLISLRPVERNDAPLIARWINDPLVTFTMFTGQRPVNREQVENLIMSQVVAFENVIFIMTDKKSGQPIGLTGLYDIHPTARKAEFRVMIGEEMFWGKGRGTEAAHLMLFYGFDRLNLHRIWLGVTAENVAGVRAYEKAGFKREGVLKEDLYRNSRYYDSIRMAVLRQEYYAKLPLKRRRNEKAL
ncbi:MAG: GNAT family N-acetyltransferase [Parcubacteria group bacterium]|nr:GNAT family N-acetyltransferase [Parcubacteria group bacterium]